MTADTRLSHLALVALLLISIPAVTAGPATAAGATTVSVSPAEQTIDAGTTTTIEIQLDNASGGVGSYDLRVASSNASAVAITEVQLSGSPGSESISFAADNSSVDVQAALTETADTGSVTLLSVTVRAEQAGDATLTVTPSAVGDEAGNDYTISGTTDGTLTVRESVRVDTIQTRPATVNESTAVQQTVEFSVQQLSADGTADQIGIRLPRDVAVSASETDLTVTNTNGDTVSVTSGPEEATAAENRSVVQFAVNPDTASETTLTVTATVPVTYPAVDTETQGTVTATVDDSTGETSSRPADIQIQDTAASGSGDLGIELRPSQQQVGTGATASYDVVMTGVDGGVGSYEITVTSANTAVATLTDITLQGSPGTQSTSFAADNSSVTANAALTDTADTGTVTLVTVTVQAEGTGTAALAVTLPNSPGDEAGNSYDISSASGGAVTVQSGPGDLTGNGQAATDPDGDGVFEDINGDRQTDTTDVTALFNVVTNQTLDSQTEQQLDINGDGQADTTDVTRLFVNVTS